ncbi:hypothetical protein [Lysobacter gummosus]|uniref:hypothetical protein n=1 Tax=Lysobacter gummosus TaxID=262324 RepID=UPI003628C826
MRLRAGPLRPIPPRPRGGGPFSQLTDGASWRLTTCSTNTNKANAYCPGCAPTAPA